jgi:hypothetical protein
MRSAARSRKPVTDADRRKLEDAGQLRFAFEVDTGTGQQHLPIAPFPHPRPAASTPPPPSIICPTRANEMQQYQRQSVPLVSRSAAGRMAGPSS